MSYPCFQSLDSGLTSRCPYASCFAGEVKDGQIVGAWGCRVELDPRFDDEGRYRWYEAVTANKIPVRTVNECPYTIDDWRRLGVPEAVIQRRIAFEATKPDATPGPREGVPGDRNNPSP